MNGAEARSGGCAGCEETFRYVLVDPNNEGCVHDTAEMTEDEARRLNKARRTRGSDLRWVKQ